MNNENLKKGNPDTQFRSGREAVENGRKGGRASGISRNFKGAVKRKLKDNPELFDQIADMLLNKTLAGDMKAFDALMDLTGESVQRESLALKRQELKLKEQSKDTSSAVLEKLDEVLGGIESGF